MGSGHHHHHGHHQHHHSHDDGAASKNIGVAFLLNFSFTIIELIGGFLTGSIAILADALHDLGDTLTLGIAFVLQRLSSQRRTEKFTYGYARLSLLSALISGLILLAGSIYILFEAIPRFWNEHEAPNGWLMMGFAVLGVAVNGIAALRLRKGSTQNEKMLSWHMIEDLLGWVAVFVGAIVITATGWTWVDPLLACALAAFISYNVLISLRQTILLFLQGSPEQFDEAAFRERVMKFDGVIGLHDVHVWSLDGDRNVLSLHVVVGNEVSAPQITKIKGEIRHLVSHLGRYHATIEIEDSLANCGDDCE